MSGPSSSFDFEGDGVAVVASGGVVGGLAYRQPNPNARVFGRMDPSRNSDPVSAHLVAQGVQSYDMGILAEGDGEVWPMADRPVRGGPADGMRCRCSAQDGTVIMRFRGTDSAVGHYRFVAGTVVWEPGKHTYPPRRPAPPMWMDYLSMPTE